MSLIQLLLSVSFQLFHFSIHLFFNWLGQWVATPFNTNVIINGVCISPATRHNPVIRQRHPFPLSPPVPRVIYIEPETQPNGNNVDLQQPHQCQATRSVVLSLFLLIGRTLRWESGVMMQTSPTTTPYYVFCWWTYFFAEPAAIISRVVPRIGSRFGVGISACVHASSLVEGWRAVNVLRVRRVNCVGHNWICFHSGALKLVRINIPGSFEGIP